MGQESRTEARTPDKDQAPEPWPERAGLAFTRQELKIFKELRPGGREGQTVFGLSRLFFWPDLVLCGPILGAPQAAMVMENLSRKGVRTFVSLGWCGSLQPDLTWGQIVLPESALSEEGTSAHYPLDGPRPGPDPDLLARLRQALEARGLAYRAGRVWSTDAPYRETKAKVARHAAAGLLAVDMETSALMTVARFRDLAWAGLLVVSDDLWGEKWRPGFDSPQLTAGLRKAAQAILDVLS